jgi:hypothetical protein
MLNIGPFRMTRHGRELQKKKMQKCWNISIGLVLLKTVALRFVSQLNKNNKLKT